MWDSNSLLQLLKSMPNQLSKENLEKIQMLIDADKYKCSLLSGFNLCDMNMYAPFCKDCTKSSIYPCAVSYINMMKAGGMDVQIGASPVAVTEQTEQVEELYEETAVSAMPENSEVCAEETAEKAVEEESSCDETFEEDSVTEEISSEETIEEVPVEEHIVEETPSEEIVEDDHTEETPVKEEQVVEEEQPVEQGESISEQNEGVVKNESELVKATEKRKIRIAVARKRL